MIVKINENEYIVESIRITQSETLPHNNNKNIKVNILIESYEYIDELMDINLHINGKLLNINGYIFNCYHCIGTININTVYHDIQAIYKDFQPTLYKKVMNEV
jgi:hypothetical protein